MKQWQAKFPLKNSIVKINPISSMEQFCCHHLQLTYRKISCEQFNIGFALPKADICKACNEFKINLHSAENEMENRKIIADLELRKTAASKAFQLLNAVTDITKHNSAIQLTISSDLH